MIFSNDDLLEVILNLDEDKPPKKIKASKMAWGGIIFFDLKAKDDIVLVE